VLAVLASRSANKKIKTNPTNLISRLSIPLFQNRERTPDAMRNINKMSNFASLWLAPKRADTTSLRKPPQFGTRARIRQMRGPAAALALFCIFPQFASALDLRGAVVVAAPNLTGTERRAVAMLVDEVEKRTGIRWPTTSTSTEGVWIEVLSQPSQPAEGYHIETRNAWVRVMGNDARGVLFGIGRLLRELRMEKGAVSIADGWSETSAPRYLLRGHQLGYRPKTNSYDGWAVPVWEQYIRDLAVFGTNAIELIPPRSDDEPDSPHFPLPPMRMMSEMSRLADEYGLDVWIWFPAMELDYSNPQTVASELREWGEVFRKLPRVDAVFVPGGDPGHSPPQVLMAFLEKETQALHRYHPKAQMWVSPQGFTQQWLDDFLSILRAEPAWLTGVVYGPQVRVSLPQLRAAVPKRYPIRHYPDITHSRQCQFPV
jgi:hypothetical protein